MNVHNGQYTFIASLGKQIARCSLVFRGARCEVLPSVIVLFLTKRYFIDDVTKASASGRHQSLLKLYYTPGRHAVTIPFQALQGAVSASFVTISNTFKLFLLQLFATTC